MKTEKAAMNALVAGHATISDKIRAIRGAISRGFWASDTNTCATFWWPISSRGGLAAPPTPRQEVPRRAQQEAGMKSGRIRVGPDGQVVISATIREALGLKEGDALIPIVENGELHLLPLQAAVRRAQAIVRRFAPEGVSLVEELLEDRRREVEREAHDG
jgi:antitoxin PrlF